MAGSGKRITRKQVAQDAGVSEAVVSYTLNGTASVAPETAARVRRAVEKLGYRPNTSARALSLGTSHSLGILMSDGANPFFAALGHAIENAARAAGYATLVANSLSGNRALHQADWLVGHQVDGLAVIQPVRDGDPAVLDGTRVPWLAIDQVGPRGVPGVGVDLLGGARTVVEHLIGHGYRRVAYIGETNGIDDRLTGWRDALSNAGLELGPSIHTNDYTRRSGYLAGQRIVRLDPLPDAVFASSDLLAVGMLRALHEAAVAVPETIALGSFDGIPETEYCWPPITTLAQPVEDMATAIVRRLTDETTRSLRFETFSGELIVRRSCGCTPSDGGAVIEEVDAGSTADR